MAVRAVPDDREYWVDAAPFRAQLRFLMASTSLSAEEVACAVGISTSLAECLLYGRRGRPLRRVSQETGRRLLQVSVEELRRRRANQEVAA
jgi:hypothetical protein